MRIPRLRRSERAPKEPKGFVGQVVELVVIVAVALGLALLIQAFLVKPYRIPSPSMVPTLDVGQRVLVNRLGNNFGNPSVGDILVFHPPKGAVISDATCGVRNGVNQACGKAIDREDTGTNFIKRLVALPGDQITIRQGHVYRKAKGTTTFKRESDGYIAQCDANTGDECTLSTPVTIPPGHYFMMGDNRGESYDSRFWGAIPRSWIIGKAFGSYWPPKRIGTL